MVKKGNKNFDLLAWQWTEKSEANITDQEIKSSYRLLLPKCSNCKKNYSGNPCCLHGLGESVWVKSCFVNDDHMQKIENELIAEHRQNGELVGLRNLGATCYVNTYLQMWFHNLDFRKAIYALNEQGFITTDEEEEDNTPHTVYGQLQLIFGLLQCSLSKTIDPTTFINCLGLPTNLQQDAQEFSKLFMCLLETTPGLSHVIESRFSGKYAYVTKCLQCQSVVETNSKFYELDLNIQGHKDLKSCILEYLKTEQLQNDNQYFCGTCSSKQDATRQIVLKELPSTLSIQLLRFVYDRSTQRKHKINTNLSFPEKLNFSDFLPTNDGIPSHNMEYNLTAVLLHRGLSASSGHFIAHILDGSSNCWYRFNDEVVMKIKGGKKLHLDDTGENAVWSDIPQEPSTKKAKTTKGSYSSKDVYMLVYSKKSDCNGNDVKPPETIMNLVENENKKFEADIAERLEIAQVELKNKLEHEAKMKELVKLLNSESEEHEWIPTAILKHFLHKGNLSGADSSCSKFLCFHGNIDLSSINSLKYIPKVAADIIYEGDGEFVRLTHPMCYHCVYNHCMVLQGKRKLEEDASIISEALNSFDNDCPAESGACYYVGRQSFRKWKRMCLDELNEKFPKKIHNSGKVDQESSSQSDDEDRFIFNSDILCQQHNLTLDLSAALIVPQIVWDIFSKHFPEAAPFQVGSSSQCAECANDAKKLEEALNSLKLEAGVQKNLLHQLYFNKNRPMSTFVLDDNMSAKCINERYYVINAEFVDRWRDFIRLPLKHEAVQHIQNEIFLCKHNKLAFDIVSYLSVLAANGRCYIDNSHPSCVVLWENEWECIKEKYSFDHAICIQKRFVLPCSVVVKKINQTSTPAPESQDGADALHSDDAGDANPSAFIQSNPRNQGKSEHENKPSVEYTVAPEVCLECMKGHALEEEKRLRTYTEADIYVVKTSKSVVEMLESDCQTPADNSARQTATARRQSRKRRCVRGEKKLSNVSSDITLKQLKVRIMNLFSVAPFDQNLWFNGCFLVDDDATLGSLNILPESTITLVEDVPNPNDVSLLYETKQSEPEIGFSGTSLLGHIDF